MNLADKLVLSTIRIYQRVNGLIPRGIFERGCRFHPTCSSYTYQAVAKYGTIRGLILGFRRVIRCHPFAKGGIDPVN